MSTTLRQLKVLQSALLECRKCEQMQAPVVVGQAISSRIYQLGQAPGPHEGKFGYPFAWTAGKTLFKWYESIGVSEDNFRKRVYMAAVCRCYPGKSGGGGDRVPNSGEIKACGAWTEQELQLLQPSLVIPVGKLAIAQMLHFKKLQEVIGSVHSQTWLGHNVDIIPLPHPSGLSTWFKTEPGRSLLAQALECIRVHPTWKNAFGGQKK